MVTTAKVSRDAINKVVCLCPRRMCRRLPSSRPPQEESLELVFRSLPAGSPGTVDEVTKIIDAALAERGVEVGGQKTRVCFLLSAVVSSVVVASNAVLVLSPCGSGSGAGFTTLAGSTEHQCCWRLTVFILSSTRHRMRLFSAKILWDTDLCDDE